MKDRDICERLRAIADLERGSPIPEWLYDGWEAGGWDVGMSKLLNEAIDEISNLRRQLWLRP